MVGVIMGIETRSKARLPSPGPYLAEITNHLDPSYMGSVEVVLIQGITNDVTKQSGTYAVKYLSPFYGVTSIRFEGNNPSDFNDVQKSYGMWMVPPDVGTTVMVIFIDGDPNQGYWLGCVQDMFQNHMVPGIAASKDAAVSPEQKRKYGTDYLPVAEFSKKNPSDGIRNPNYIDKPVHPFADRLLEQGLILDTTRGVTSSSARREVPSSVFGISTPGPLDPNGKKGKIGYEGSKLSPISRLGGSTFVMDDGDINGDNELVRIRTRTGHQILMHNTKDLIYIANSKGTAWIELTGNGKIDVYAKDSVSIHSEKDFNFRAEGNINLEAGGSINMKSAGNFLLSVAENGYLTFGSNLDIGAGGDTKLSANGNTNIASGGEHIESASAIHMNGPAAATADPAPMPDFTIPGQGAIGSGSPGPEIKSIMPRVPTHEPWPDHESK
jgi:hypothetical protein